ncbi:MAG TPA: DUF2071 domain-containing protein, partial [Aquella sp.]|nr:DUF2071 domain-containing protein [Aquella sp.]
TNFCEVNLRFYVRYKNNGQWQRGVVFIKEFVPKRVVAFIANTFYNENYAAVTMKHHWQEDQDSLTVNYSWKKGQWHSFGIVTENKPIPIKKGSEEEFIAEHYWGYTKHNKTESLEYKVEHPVWKIHPVRSHSVDVDFTKAYGEQWKFLNSIKPQSVLLAEGSEISVGSKRKLR